MNICAYATLEDVKEYLAGFDESLTANKDDNRLKKFCLETSRKFEKHCGRKFYPTLETRTLPHPCYDNTVLPLDDDLLAVSTLTTSNGNTTISSSDYWLMNGKSQNWQWYDRIELKPSGTQATFTYSSQMQDANAVTGLWGRHDDYSSAWASVDTVQDNPLSASATEVTVEDTNGLDDLAMSPRFKILQLIRFGTGVTAEMAFVTGKNTNTGKLTIVRGVNGTTAAEQAQSTAIYVYRPMSEITHAMEVFTTYDYRRKDNVGRDIDQPVASSTGVVILPNRLPSEVKEMLREFKRHEFAY